MNSVGTIVVLMMACILVGALLALAIVVMVARGDE
jgi:hypothetical protein